MKKKINFDDYSADYNEIMQKQHKIFGDITYYSEYKIKIVKEIIPNKENMKILEYGCGIGRNLRFIKNFYPNSQIYCSDVSIKSLEVAKKENPFCTILTIDELNKYESYFDFIFIAGVYHHIEPVLRTDITIKIHSYLKAGGIVAVFEHNPYNPLTVKMVNTCEFDSDAVLIHKKELNKLFINNGFSLIKSKYTLFVPPKLKKINFIEKYLGWFPLGGQYYSFFIKK